MHRNAYRKGVIRRFEQMFSILKYNTYCYRNVYIRLCKDDKYEYIKLTDIDL